MVTDDQDSLALLPAQPVRDQAGSIFKAILGVAITNKGLPPRIERAQADADLAAGVDQVCTSGMGAIDQLDRLAAVSGAGQPSASYEQKASHFFRCASKASIARLPQTFAWLIKPPD